MHTPKLNKKRQQQESTHMIYANPGSEGALINFKAQYGNYIGGEWVEPVNGQYFENISPVNGKVFCKIPRSDKDDINLALDTHDGIGIIDAGPMGEKPGLLNAEQIDNLVETIYQTMY